MNYAQALVSNGREKIQVWVEWNIVRKVSRHFSRKIKTKFGEFVGVFICNQDGEMQMKLFFFVFFITQLMHELGMGFAQGYTRWMNKNGGDCLILYKYE